MDAIIDKMSEESRKLIINISAQALSAGAHEILHYFVKNKTITETEAEIIFKKCIVDKAERIEKQYKGEKNEHERISGCKA